MRKIAVIGAGNMGKAIIKGIKGRYKITASDVNKNKLKGLGVSTTTDNSTAVKNADIIILAIKPQNMNFVLNEIKNIVNPKQLIISIAAGISTGRIENKLGRIPVIRVMPNMPLLVGMGISALCKGRYAKSVHLKDAGKIFSSIVYIKKEALMDAVTAISGSGPAYVYLFIESLIKSAMDLGINKNTAAALVLQTLKGSVALLEKSKKSPEELRRQVTSPGGTTEAALKVFEKREFDKLINEAIGAAYTRSRELSR